MNKLIRMGMLGLSFSALALIGHYLGWGVEGQRNAWLLNPLYVNAVSGFFAGSGSTLLLLGLKQNKE